MFKVTPDRCLIDYCWTFRSIPGQTGESWALVSVVSTMESSDATLCAFEIKIAATARIKTGFKLQWHFLDVFSSAIFQKWKYAQIISAKTEVIFWALMLESYYSFKKCLSVNEWICQLMTAYIPYVSYPNVCIWFYLSTFAWNMLLLIKFKLMQLHVLPTT